MNDLDALGLARKMKRDTPGEARYRSRSNSANVGTARMAIRELFLKTDTERELQRAIELVSAVHTYLRPSLTNILYRPESDDRTLEHFTPREITTPILAAQGMSMKMAADRMGISVKTADTHKNNLGRKLGRPSQGSPDRIRT
jgi:DNA-binding NarL/FixJ family response regulator